MTALGESIGELIARLEAASEGSRLLDGLIGVAVGWRNDERYTDGGATEMAFLLSHGHAPAQEEIGGRMGLPHYTTSLDAALTLVPEGFVWHVGVLRHYCGDGWADNVGRLVFCADVRRDGKILRPDDFVDAEAKSAALALCVAALKARAAQ